MVSRTKKKRNFLVVLIFLGVALYIGCAVLFGGAEERKQQGNGVMRDDSGYQYLEYGDHICIVAYDGSEDELVIPQEMNGKPVTRIGDGEASGFTQAYSVQIPDTVTEMGNYVFKECQHLQSVILSSNTAKIPAGAFENCKNLTRLTLPDAVRAIGPDAFLNSGIGNLALPGCEEIVMCEKTLYNKGESLILRIPEAVKNIRFTHSETGEELEINSFRLNSPDGYSDAVVVYGAEGSYAEIFAGQWGLSFVKVEDTEGAAKPQVHISKEMVQECMQIGAELQEYVDSRKLEEGDSETALRAVYDWLQNDPRVLFAEINMQCVLYSSVDHVAGMYEFPPEEGYLGSISDEEETGGSLGYKDCDEIAAAYTTYMETGNLRAQEDTDEGIVYFDGLNSITNEKFLLLSTESDSLVTELREKFSPMADRYEEELGYEAHIAADPQTRGEILLADKSLDQYGIVVWAAHGGTYRKSNGSYLAYSGINLVADEIIETMYESDTSITPEDENYDLFYIDGGSADWDHTILYVQNGGIYMTANYFTHFYDDRQFDNTIFFFGACSYGKDTDLMQFLLGHGAKAVVAFEASASEPLLTGAYDDFFGTLLETEKQNRKSLKETKEKNLGLLVVSKINNIENWGIDKFKWLGNKPTGNNKDSYPVIYTASEAFSLEHYGTLSGNVKLRTKGIEVSEDGEVSRTTQFSDCRSADLYFYRFANQAFEPGDAMRVSVGQDGAFEAENLRWGVYAIALTGEEIMDTVAGTVFGDDSFDGGEILADKWGTSVKAVVAAEVDGERRYISGAEVSLTLEHADLEEEAALVGSTYTYTTDEEGGFWTERLPSGSYQMKIEAQEGRYSEAYHWENSTDYFYEGPIILEAVDYYAFIRDELLPRHGYASQEDTECRLERSTFEGSKGWDERSGLISADVVDLNMDGIDELLVHRIEESVSEEEGIPCTSHHVDLYTMQDGEIVLAASIVNNDYLSDYGLDKISVGIMELDGRNYLYVEREKSEYFSNMQFVYYVWLEYRDNGWFMDRYSVLKSDGGSTDIAYSLIIWDEDGTREDCGSLKLPIWEETPGCAEGADAPPMLENIGWQPGMYDMIMSRGFQEIPGLSQEYISGGDGYPTYWGSPALKKSWQYYSRGDRDTNGVSMRISLQDETGLKEKIDKIS